MAVLEEWLQELWTSGKQRTMVQPRKVLSYRWTREFRMRTDSTLKKINIASSSASESALRGRQIVAEHGWSLLEEPETGNPRMSLNSTT